MSKHIPFRYDFVGSFLRPARLKEARAGFQAGKIDAAQLKKVEDEFVTSEALAQIPLMAEVTMPLVSRSRSSSLRLSTIRLIR